MAPKKLPNRAISPANVRIVQDVALNNAYSTKEDCARTLLPDLSDLARDFCALTAGRRNLPARVAKIGFPPLSNGVPLILAALALLPLGSGAILTYGLALRLSTKLARLLTFLSLGPGVRRRLSAKSRWPLWAYSAPNKAFSRNCTLKTLCVRALAAVRPAITKDGEVLCAESLSVSLSSTWPN